MIKKNECQIEKGDGKCCFLSFSVMIRYIRKNIKECESEAGIFMDITMLGTGNAMVTECYNTCFVLRDGDKHLLVDGGGGNTVLSQLKKAGCEDRRELPYHKMLLHGELPYTIGGGIGQSRICMFFLRKAHIGEVHVSLWPKEMQEEAAKGGIPLL